MNESVKKELRMLMFKIDVFRINYSIEKLKKDMNIYNILKKQKVSEDFIREFIGWMGGPEWGLISYCQNLSESFIREFQDKVEWGLISYCQNLSESFIREFQDKVDWSYISIGQNLSESFIREFQDKVHWNDLSENQILSENFLLEFKDRLNYYCLVKNKKIKFSKKFKDIIYRVKNEPWEIVGVNNCQIIKEELGLLEEEIRIRNKYNRFEIMDI